MAPQILSNTPPLDYTVPGFPSLYWPIQPSPGEASFLYYSHDIWRFTFYWTLIIFLSFHFVASMWALAMQVVARYEVTHPLAPGPPGVKQQAEKKQRQRDRHGGKGGRKGGKGGMGGMGVWAWIIPVMYCIVGGVEAALAGSVVGLM
jgi:hypothetical protein